ncbi:MAG: hypothetical protein IPL06_17370 [Betaproteobacteria bacterium]|nr:hypothetical protein [Betaproteobacteria bacterium]
MPKLLRAVRLDDSDDHLFKTHGAAREGEWVVSGGYAVCDFARAPKCDPRCYCESSFLALESRRRCSIAEVVEVSDADLEERTDQLAWFLVKGWGAPSWETARSLAEEEIRHTAEVCETLSPEVWITVKRTPQEIAGTVDEQYAVYDRLMIGAHRL